MESFRSRSAPKGASRARYLANLFGRELRLARMTVGLTQADLGRLAEVTQQQVSLVERGVGGASLLTCSRLAAACGHELGWRLYPVATVRLRDSGQLELAQAVTAAAHPSWRPRLEVPVAPGDQRAADLVLSGLRESIHIEIERALVDFQAQLRSAQLKREALAAREDRPIRLVIAVPDTRSTRAKLAPFTQLIANALPAASTEIWRTIRTGEPLTRDGILFVRAPRQGRGPG
ncbi:MAG: helix-turn-helix transcriptional regulator [Chloroflexota bacterium]